MARIFVAHTEQGAPSILGAAADAIQEQRALAQEQQRSAREQALAEREFEYQRQRDKISDKFKREELALKRQSARTTTVGEVSELQAMQYGAAELVTSHFAKFNAIPEDQRMPADQRQAGQEQVERVLLRIQSAPDVATARVHEQVLKRVLSEHDTALKDFQDQREVADLLQSRDKLQETLLDPAWLDTAGVSENTVLNLRSDTQDPEALRKQIGELQALEQHGKTNARLSGVLAEITDGTYKSDFTPRMQELHETANAPEIDVLDAYGTEVEPPWLAKYPGWRGKGGKLEQMNSLGVPVGKRNEILKEYLGLLQMEADPNLHSVRDGMIRQGRELRSVRVRAEAEAELLSAVTQATLPELDRVASGLQQIASGTDDEYTPEERALASAMEDVMLSDPDLAAGRVGPGALVNAFRQVQSVMDVDPNVARGLFMRIQQMGLPSASQPSASQPAAKAPDNAQSAGGSVLDISPQGDPLAGQRKATGKGVVDFSLKNDAGDDNEGFEQPRN